MALLEAVVRARQVSTCVRGLWIDGRSWYPRFSWVRPFIPRRLLLAWPQFLLQDSWVDFAEIFADIPTLVEEGASGFANVDESLFDAVRATPVDFFGKSQCCGGACRTGIDLSGYVLEDLGFFDSRDELFARFGTFHKTLQGLVFEIFFDGKSAS